VLIHQLVVDGANRHPDAEAWVWTDRDLALTYAEAAEAIEQAAGALAGLGIGKGDRLGIFAHNGMDYLIAMFAAFRLGAIAALVNVKYSDDLDYYLNDCTPKALIYTHDHLPTIERHRGSLTSIEHYVCLDGPQEGALSWPDLLENPDRPPADTTRDTDTAHLAYTSGTTGNPKGACLAHGPTVRATRCIAERLRLDRDDVISGPTALSSSNVFVASLLPSLHRGATALVTSRWDVHAAWRFMDERSVTVLSANPPILTDVLEKARESGGLPGALRLSISGGGPVSPALKRAWRDELGVPLAESFGQSELGGFVALATPDPPLDDKLLAVGRQLPDKDVRIFGDDDTEVPTGRTGEIVIRGGFMNEYWGRPEQTEETLRGGWLHTGDVGVIDKDGFVYVRGRLSERLAVKGDYWYPRDLEEVLLQHPAVKEAALVGTSDEELGTKPVAFVTTMTNPFDEGAIKRYLSETIDIDVGLLTIRSVESMPYTPTDKINRAQLRALLEDSR
jgi:long-chain acyl-CoA synthetase